MSALDDRRDLNEEARPICLSQDPSGRAAAGPRAVLLLIAVHTARISAFQISNILVALSTCRFSPVPDDTCGRSDSSAPAGHRGCKADSRSWWPNVERRSPVAARARGRSLGIGVEFRQTLITKLFGSPVIKSDLFGLAQSFDYALSWTSR